MIRTNICQLLVVTISILLCHQSLALTISDELKIYADFRLRFESDFSSHKANGTRRDDRDRLRARARVGMTFSPREDIEFGIRLRSGSDDSHQSPHITLVDFDDNDTGDANFNFDKWYLKYKGNGYSFTAGRSGLAFWKQNEILFDDDVTPMGVSYALSGSHLGLNAGYYTLPVGMQRSSGNLGAVQVTLKADIGSGTFAGAVGLAQFNAEPGDGDASTLLDGNGTRDYSIWAVNGQLKFDHITLGADYFINTEDYSANDADAFTAYHRDQDTGYVLSGSYGNTSPQSWLFAYYYLNVETFAVNSSFAQDDWVRFGSAVETRASNIKGHEFRIGYGLAKNMNLLFRAYILDAIRKRAVGSAAREDGNRIRLDFNYKF